MTAAGRTLRPVPDEPTCTYPWCEEKGPHNEQVHDGGGPPNAAGPVLRAVITMQLNDNRGSAVPPRPTTEYGGLPKAPAGSIVRLSIGNARTFYAPYADRIVGALVDAAEIEVIGSDPQGVTETRAALAAALGRTRRHPG